MQAKRKKSAAPAQKAGSRATKAKAAPKVKTGTSTSRSAAKKEGNTVMSEANPPKKRSEDEVGLGNLAQVRDILFGAQMRDYEKRFSRLEERLQAESDRLKEDTKKRIESLEIYVKKEMDGIGERLKAEQGVRAEAVKEINKELKAVSNGLEKKVGQLEDQLTKTERGLNEHILDQTNKLREETTEKLSELKGALERDTEELRESKADRTALADLFMEMSLRLKDEFELPGLE